MKKLEIHIDPKVEAVFNKYPGKVRKKMETLRKIILEVAGNSSEIFELEETLKWGEPSYLTKVGSTIRIDWKPKTPDQFAMYFKCTSKLVPTFRKVYPDIFTFEDNRAIVFSLDDDLPVDELRQCILAGLMYHKVKKLPLLGLTEG